MSPPQDYDPHDSIHIDLDRVHYAVTEAELEQLRNAGQSLWKDVCIASLPLGLSLLINAIAEIRSQSVFSMTLSLFLNSLIGIVSLILGMIFGVAWYRISRGFNIIVDAIKQKPKIELLRVRRERNNYLEGEITEVPTPRTPSDQNSPNLPTSNP